MTLLVLDIIAEVERFAPPELAMPGDPIGLCLGRADADIAGVTIALDLTSDVIEAALADGTNLIVTHHPAIYTPLQALTSASAEGDNLLTCAENGIALFSAHTNADACAGGTADLLAELLLPGRQGMPLIAMEEHAGREGFGRVLDNLNETTAQMHRLTRDSLGAPFARLLGDEKRGIRTLAVWPGSMDESVVEACQKQKVDLLIAGECKHHLTLMLAARGIDLIIAGHDRTEQPLVSRLKTLLQKRFPDLPVFAVDG